MRSYAQSLGTLEEALFLPQDPAVDDKVSAGLLASVGVDAPGSRSMQYLRADGVETGEIIGTGSTRHDGGSFAGPRPALATLSMA